MLDTVRAFIAVNLEIGTIRRVAALQRSLRTSAEAPNGRVSWVSAPNVHLTLRALGPIDRPLAPALGDGLAQWLRLARRCESSLATLAPFLNHHVLVW